MILLVSLIVPSAVAKIDAADEADLLIHDDGFLVMSPQ